MGTRWNRLGEAVLRSTHNLCFGAISVEFCLYFLIFAQNMDCRYTLEPPRRSGSDKDPQSMFWSKNKKKKGIPLHTAVLLIRSGVHGGIHYTDMFS